MLRSICFYTDSANFGGAEQMMLTLLAYLDRKCWQPTLIYHAAPGLAPLLEKAQKLEVTLWEIPPMPEGWLGAWQVPGFVRALLARRPAVFHAHLTWPRACKFGLLAAILARVPAIVASEQLFVEVPHNSSAIFQQRLLAWGIGRYIAVSNDVAKRLVQTYRYPTQKMCVIHNGIDVSRFDCQPSLDLQARLRREAGQAIVLTLARLDKQKGHSYLLEAAIRVPEAMFILVGDGPERATLEAQVQTLGLSERVTFLGYRADIPELLASCDLVVLPSLYEGLPISILEAMAASKPVVATRIGGTDEVIIDGETGILVPPVDPQALVEAIQRLLHDPALAQRLGQAGKLRSQQFSAPLIAGKVMKVYSELLDGKAS